MAVAYAYPTGAALQDMSFMASGQGYSYQDNITALAGGGRPGATLLTKALNRVVTVGTAADSVMLPAATGGQALTVVNAHASNACQIFAFTGTSDTINGVAAATGISLAAGKTIELVSFPAIWHGVLSA